MLPLSVQVHGGWISTVIRSELRASEHTRADTSRDHNTRVRRARERPGRRLELHCSERARSSCASCGCTWRSDYDHHLRGWRCSVGDCHYGEQPRHHPQLARERERERERCAPMRREVSLWHGRSYPPLSQGSSWHCSFFSSLCQGSSWYCSAGGSSLALQRQVDPCPGGSSLALQRWRVLPGTAAAGGSLPWRCSWPDAYSCVWARVDPRA